MTLKAGKRLEEIYMIRRVIQIDEDKCNDVEPVQMRAMRVL